MPFGDPLSLVTLLVVVVAAGLFLRMIGKEKDRRDRHILLRYFELEQEENEKLRKEAARDAESKSVADRKLPERLPSPPRA